MATQQQLLVEAAFYISDCTGSPIERRPTRQSAALLDAADAVVAFRDQATPEQGRRRAAPSLLPQPGFDAVILIRAHSDGRTNERVGGLLQRLLGLVHLFNDLDARSNAAMMVICADESRRQFYTPLLSLSRSRNPGRCPYDARSAGY